ncbi:Ig-like domain repeat protein [Granulicella mallensis]|uniref:Peptidase S53 propeptide n=1 Tax=Granulicella mallensis (strain ATCC BAA-1857 / DSM 23137 / MP5ACTX8) TaxID=682795 RepID=G8NS72_GRAMM|nr:Ig-like domain repeat protein [Granulicella mallensis]AEU37366.1 Peptidase S53 propeptide [Granulicella mallensis MP5ACTX8]
MLVRLRRIVWNAALCLLLGAFAVAQQPGAPAASAIAPVPAVLTQRIDDSQRITLPNSVVPTVKRASDLGVLSPAQQMNRMVLVLKRSATQQKDLDTLVAAQQKKGTPQYHQWLTPEAFSARFAPAPGDVAKVAAWLQSHGFTQVAVSRSGQRIEFSGGVSSVESAFGTSMHQYQLKTAAGTENHIANATTISIPAALAPVVSGVLSLNNFTSKPLHTTLQNVVRNAAGKFVKAKGDTTFTDGNGDFEYALSPSDVSKIYGATTLPAGVDGTGVSIAVIGRSDIVLSDLQTFRKLFALPVNDPNMIVSGPDPGLNSLNDAIESSLDLEWAGAIAPKATVNFVIAGSTDTTDGISLAAAYAVENVVSPIMTVSYGACEKDEGPSGNLFWSTLWEQAAAEGITALASSGDGGAGICDADYGNSPDIDGDSVNGIASTPYNLAVGGTQFAEGDLAFQYWDSNNSTGFASALGYIPEAVWNQSCDPTLPVGVGSGNCAYGQTYYESTGGGGGRSNCATGTVDNSGNVTCTAGYPKPSWQSGTGVPADGVRDIPDVALNASGVDDPYIICFLGSCTYTQTSTGTSLTGESLVGGTSASSPVMASILALVEQQNGAFQGLVNPTLYSLAQQNASCSSSARTDPAAPVTCIFNDVIVGNNSAPGLPGYGTDTADFTAGVGYDLATGLGSVNIANLVAGWKAGTGGTATTTQLTATTTTAKHGTAVPLSVAVTSASGTPGGDFVLLTDKYGANDQYTLGSDGTWTGQVKDLPGGTYTLTARYAGDGTYASSTSAGTSLNITPEDSTPMLAVDIIDPNTGALVPSTPTSNFLGSALFFKGSVAGLSGQGIPTGTVNVLMDGTTNLGSTTLTLDAGVLLSSGTVPVGNHAITLQYLGDNSFNPSTSSPVSVVVAKGQSSTLVQTGNGITAYLGVSGTTQPTGTLQIFDEYKGVSQAISQPMPIVMGANNSGPQVNIPYTFTPGSHSLQAVYSGDTNYVGVALNSPYAKVTTINVGSNTGAATTTTFTMTTPATLQQGQIANFVFTVKSQSKNANVPSGLVLVYPAGSSGAICGGNLVNGTATGACYMDGAGTFVMSATYEGDNNFASSTSAAKDNITLTVPKLTPAVTFAAGASYILPNTQLSLNYTTAGLVINSGGAQQAPTGTITFTDSVNGAAATPLGNFQLLPINGLLEGYSGRFTLPVGTNVVTATYPGDPNFNAVVSSTMVVVSPPDFVFTSGQAGLQLTAGAPGAATLSLTPELGYTGSVTLACGTGVPAGAVCVVNPSSVTFGTAQTATVSISTPAPSPMTSARVAMKPAFTGSVLELTSLAGLLLFCLPAVRRRPGFLLVLLAVLLPVVGCGGSSPSAPVPQATLLSLTSSNTKTASGQSVSLVATLNSLASNPTGTIKFYDGSTELGSSVTVMNGTATLASSTLAVGAHTITAVYSGDAKDSGSTSSPVTQVITGSSTLQITATSGTLVHSISLPITLN